MIVTPIPRPVIAQQGCEVALSTCSLLHLRGHASVGHDARSWRGPRSISRASCGACRSMTAAAARRKVKICCRRSPMRWNIARGCPREGTRSQKAPRADRALPRRYRVFVDISQRPRTSARPVVRQLEPVILPAIPPTPAEATQMANGIRGSFDRQVCAWVVFGRRCRHSGSLPHAGDVGWCRTAGMTLRQTGGAFKIAGPRTPRHPQGLRRRSGG
jgi:hypothetical protein